MNATDAARLPRWQPTTRMLAMPTDTNANGDIFGGWIMSQVDIAGALVAARTAGGRVVTVAVNEFQFHKPVYIGDLISCYGEILRVGRTSITVDVEVFAQRWIEGAEQVIRVTEAQLTYVAIDENRQPRPVIPEPRATSET